MYFNSIRNVHFFMHHLIYEFLFLLGFSATYFSWNHWRLVFYLPSLSFKFLGGRLGNKMEWGRWRKRRKKWKEEAEEEDPRDDVVVQVWNERCRCSIKKVKKEVKIGGRAFSVQLELWGLFSCMGPSEGIFSVKSSINKVELGILVT